MSGVLTSNLHDDVNPNDSNEVEYDAAINGVESLILSLACEGIDVSTPEFVSAINTTLDKIANFYL